MSILSNVDWQKQGSEAFTYLKGLGNKVKQMALQLTEVEIKVEDATNNQPWGPHGKDMAGKITIHGVAQCKSERRFVPYIECMGQQCSGCVTNAGTQHSIHSSALHSPKVLGVLRTHDSC